MQFLSAKVWYLKGGSRGDTSRIQADKQRQQQQQLQFRNSTVSDIFCVCVRYWGVYLDITT